MTGYGTVQIGRLSLREAITPATDQLSASSGSGRTLDLTGQEMQPALSAAQLAQVTDDLVGQTGALLVPVQFSNKSDRNGYYQVVSAGAQILNWPGEMVTCDWKCQLVRVGSDTDIDIEARVSGPQTRTNSFSVTGERWHAPPIGHYAYWAGTTQPTTVTRSTIDGNITVYRGVTVGVNPRYGCAVANYLLGRVRFTDTNGYERAGLSPGLSPWWWTLSNGMLQVQPTGGAGVLVVSAYTGFSWQPKTWDITVGGVSLGAPTAVTLLRNEFEIVVVRLLFAPSPPGRVTVDMTLRRGSRLLELYVQSEYAATIVVQRLTAEAGTNTSGYVVATSNDAASNKYLIGSAKTFTALTTQGGVQVTAATALDACIGVIAGGTGAVAGDQAATIFGQYLGAAPEYVQGVRR